MSEVSSLWWTDERIEATLCRQYVFSQLQPDHQSRLFEPLPWGEGLTSETYLEWILTKAGKLFLILNELSIPHRIFDLADDFVDDSDLPFAESRVPDLPLIPQDESVSSSAAASLNNKFFLTQWRYLVRGIAEGEHVRYTENEGVPVEVLKTGLVGSNNNRDGVEKVVLSGATCRVFLRTQVGINAAPYFSEEDEVLEEIRSLRQLAHEHVLSIYGSYTVDNSINVLFSGVYERSLLSFLSDTPQNFKKLPKPDRREILVNWPHCLVSGLAWLHANGHPHGSIRPSNVLVDSDYRIFLGHFEGLDTLLDSPKINDIEAYQYAAPERWIRTTAIQETNGAKTSFHSGGRTMRGPASSSSSSSSSASPKTPRASWMTAGSTQSSESRGTVIRVGSRNSLVSSSSSSASGGSGGSHGKSAHKLFRTKPILYTPSIHSSNLASDSRTRPVTAPESAASIPFVPHNTALVRTWQSQQVNAQLSDIFSLGAVITDIFTFLCERKISSFANHRSAKNRTPGRGGGVADASFHLVTNLPQVTSWLTVLTADSKKRKGLAFRAVEPMLAVVRDMMARAPERRPSAEEVEARFAHTIRQLEGIIVAHCKQVPSNQGFASYAMKPVTPPGPVDMPLPPSPNLHPREYNSLRAGSRPRRQEILDDEDLEPNNLPNFSDHSNKRAKPRDQHRALHRLDTGGYDFDFGFASKQHQHQHQQQYRDDQSPTSTNSSATPPPSSGNSYSSLHHQEQMLGMRQYHQQQNRHNRDKKYDEKRDKKDKDVNAATIDETIIHLRKALEEKLNREYDDDHHNDNNNNNNDNDDDENKRRRRRRDDRRRYFDDLALRLNGSNLNLPRYEA